MNSDSTLAELPLRALKVRYGTVSHAPLTCTPGAVGVAAGIADAIGGGDGGDGGGGGGGGGE